MDRMPQHKLERQAMAGHLESARAIAAMHKPYDNGAQLLGDSYHFGHATQPPRPQGSGHALRKSCPDMRRKRRNPARSAVVLQGLR